jgi:hypothetical protein
MLVPDELLKTVVFLAYNEPSGMKFAGTAFLIGIPFGNGKPDKVHEYLVTAKHVIKKIEQDSSDKLALVRINITGGNSPMMMETKVGDWVSHPDDPFVDISISSFKTPSNADVRYVPPGICVSREQFEPGGNWLRRRGCCGRSILKAHWR